MPALAAAVPASLSDYSSCSPSLTLAREHVEECFPNEAQAEAAEFCQRPQQAQAQHPAVGHIPSLHGTLSCLVFTF